MKKTNRKIELLRQKMQDENIQACIIPTTDPHISEYTPAHWKTREWLSGFTGSAGTLVITSTKAGLWTDSRYFLQAADQLQDTEIELFKMALPDTPEIPVWITGELQPGDTVGLEGAVYAASEVRSLIADFTEKGLTVDPRFAPYDSLWEERPPLPANKAFILPERFSGKSTREKISELLVAMKEYRASTTILASLDTIAWLFNLRGNDVEYNPVCVAYAVVSEKETVLFIDPAKLTDEVASYLTSQQVIPAAYDRFYPYLSKIAPETSVLITPSKVNYRILSSIPGSCLLRECSVHPADQLKAVKNETEIAGFRNALRKDGIALVRFLIWLERSLANGETITESDVSRKLREYRGEQEFFFGESFETIAGYGEHGAIVHYGVTEESNIPIRPEGLLLVDSGGQYFDGTTDITRTIACGRVSEEMKRDYTRVLKGHIALASCHFPSGTIGMQLDVLARQFLWSEGCNFLHGTGHGIGHFLNVHEGPQSIRMNYNPVVLEPGMVTSNEPGLYRAGKYGVRIENLLLTREDKSTPFGDFYAFETITLCPIDKTPIDPDLLTPGEADWLNNYHRKVYNTLEADLNEDERAWLKERCKPI